MTIPELDPSDYDPDNQLPEELTTIVVAAILDYESSMNNVLVAGASKGYIIGNKIAYERLEKEFITDEIEDDVYEFVKEYKKQIDAGYTVIQGEKVYWLRDRTLAERQALFDIISKGIIQGKSPNVVTTELQKHFDTSRSYAETLARTETAYVQANGRDNRYKKQGVKKVKWLLGKRPCSRCAPLGGNVFTWDGLPYSQPVHPRCFTPDTEVETADGFKFIKDCIVGEYCLSLDPDTFETGYVKIKNVYQYDYSGAMFRFKSDDVDLIVTPDHQMFIRENKEWIFKDAECVTSMSGFLIIPRPLVELPQYVDDVQISTEEYSGLVCCVELEKYHTIYTRRNSKCVWSGNCTCDLAPMPDDAIVSDPIKITTPIKEPKTPTIKKPIETKPKEKSKKEPIKEPTLTREEVEKLIKDKELALLGRTTEKGILFDKNGKILLEKEGTKNKIQFTPDEVKLFKNNILTHNHPRGTSFSSADVELACYSNMKEIRVAAEKRTYIMRVNDGSNFNAKLWNDKISSEYEKQYNKSLREYIPRLQRGEITEDHADYLVHHFAWVGVSKNIPEIEYLNIRNVVK